MVFVGGDCGMAENPLLILTHATISRSDEKLSSPLFFISWMYFVLFYYFLIYFLNISVLISNFDFIFH